MWSASVASRARAAELDAGLLERDEVLERLRRLAEAVLQLGPQLDQLGHLARARDPPVHVDLGGFEGHVLGREVGVDGDVQAQLAVRSSSLASGLAAYLGGAAERLHGLLQHRHVQLEANRCHMPRLLVAEQVAGPAQLEVAHRDLEAGA